MYAALSAFIGGKEEEEGQRGAEKEGEEQREREGGTEKGRESSCY